MTQDLLMQIQASLVSALLKSAALARDLIKAGFRPDLLPSSEGRDLARLILRLRDARGDVTADVDAHVAQMQSVSAEVARLLELARGAPCPDRERALAYLAALELSETSERLRVTAAQFEELLGPSLSPGNPRAGAAPSRTTSPRPFRRITLPEPASPSPSRPPDPRKPAKG